MVVFKAVVFSMPEIVGSCSHCGEEFSFETKDMEGEYRCPHCNHPLGKFSKAANKAIAAVIFLTVVGSFLVLSGCVQELEARSEGRQLICTVQYTSGFLLIGLALIAHRMKKG